MKYMGRDCSKEPPPLKLDTEFALRSEEIAITVRKVKLTSDTEFAQ